MAFPSKLWFDNTLPSPSPTSSASVCPSMLLVVVEVVVLAEVVVTSGKQQFLAAAAAALLLPPRALRCCCCFIYIRRRFAGKRRSVCERGAEGKEEDRRRPKVRRRSDFVAQEEVG